MDKNGQKWGYSKIKLSCLKLENSFFLEKLRTGTNIFCYFHNIVG